jgi:outer membrane protein assembly factor BamB
LPLQWTEKNIAWKVKLPGVGHSSPVVWGERIFVTSGDDKTGTRIALCLRTGDGKLVWKRELAGPRHGRHADNSFASASPAADVRQVYFCWASPQDYLIVALDHDGKEAWRVDLGPFKSGHGFGASPIVHEDQLIVADEQDGKSFLVALDTTTSNCRWKIPRRSKAGFATPCVFRPVGRAAELIFTSWEHGITAIDPRSGKTCWEAEVFSRGHLETPIASPIVSKDLVLGTCGWLGVKYETVAVRPYPAAGKGPPPTLYRMERTPPLVPTPLVKDDMLFLWNDRGIVTCVNVSTGEKYWSERVPGSYYASPVCAGRGLYGVSREGDVIVLAAAKRFQLLARNPLGEASHSTPAIAGNRMFVRTFSYLLCVGPETPGVAPNGHRR